MDAVRSDLFRLAQLVVALNATVAKLEGEGETHWKEDEKAFGQVDDQVKALDEGLRLDLSFDGIGGAQRPTLAVFILLVGVARSQPFFMLLSLAFFHLFAAMAKRSLSRMYFPGQHLTYPAHASQVSIFNPPDHMSTAHRKGYGRFTVA